MAAQFQPMIRNALLILVATLGLTACGAKPPTDLDAARKQIARELDTFITSIDVQKAVAKEGLTGMGKHSYTFVVGKGGMVETILSNNADDKTDYNQQNKLTRILRTFKATVPLRQNERVKIEQVISL